MRMPKYISGNGKVGIGSALVIYGMVLLAVVTISPYLENQITNPFLTYAILRGLELVMFIFFLSICMHPNGFPMKRILASSQKTNWDEKGAIVVPKLLCIALALEVTIQISVATWSHISNPQEFSKNMAETLTTSAFPPNAYLLLFGDRSVLSHCVIAAIVEEIIFRGIFLNILLNRFRTICSIVISSLIFGAIHSNFLSAFLGSLFFSWAYVAYGRLWLCILLHAFGNLLLTIFFGFGGGALLIYIVERNFICTGLLFIAMLIAGLIFKKIRTVKLIKTTQIFIS